MNDARSKYNRELDLILQELAADEELQEQTIQKQRDEAWKALEKLFKGSSNWEGWKTWTPAKMEQMKKQFLDKMYSENDQE